MPTALPALAYLIFKTPSVVSTIISLSDKETEVLRGSVTKLQSGGAPIQGLCDFKAHALFSVLYC